MKRLLAFVIVNVALFGPQIGSTQSVEFNPEILDAKARTAYSKLEKACVFRVGGVGYAGQTSKEELALYDLLEDAHALDALRSLVKTASYEGGLYGLIGLSIRDHGEFSRAVEVYKARKERPARQQPTSFECFEVTGETVITQSGCLIDEEQRDKVVSAMQSGRYDRMLRAHHQRRNE